MTPSWVEAKTTVHDNEVARAFTNMIAIIYGAVHHACRNAKRWRNTRMALRWTVAGVLKALKGHWRLEAYKLLPFLKAALENHRNGSRKDHAIDRRARAAQCFKPRRHQGHVQHRSGHPPETQRRA